MNFVKIKTVYDESLYIDRDEYRRKVAAGRNLVKVYFSTGKVRTIKRQWKRDPETMILHIENIQESDRALLAQEPHPEFWRVYEGPILRANQSTREGAEHYMQPGRVLIPPSRKEI